MADPDVMKRARKGSPRDGEPAAGDEDPRSSDQPPARKEPAKPAPSVRSGVAPAPKPPWESR